MINSKLRVYKWYSNGLFLLVGMMGAQDHGTQNAAENAATPVYEFGIIGAGPGGIITVGALLDVGLLPEHMIWFDQEFNVGRMGKYYAKVPANNKAKHLVEFFSMCSAFQHVQTPAVLALKNASPDLEYPLKLIIDPLQDITNYFLTKVQSVRGAVTMLAFRNGVWHIACDDQIYKAKRVVLATGSHPRSFNYNVSTEIPLDQALVKSSLAQLVNSDDTIAVVGGSHSAVLVMKYLSELDVARIVNFYRHPLVYSPAVPQKIPCTVHPHQLEGVAAIWAREVLDGNPPGNLVRVKISNKSLKAWLPICTKIIYAVGFERNQLPLITGIDTANIDTPNGIIGPHLFGIGIAFPEIILDEGKSSCTLGIGLRDFMRFAQKAVPEWVTKCELSWYDRFSELIVYEQL